VHFSVSNGELSGYRLIYACTYYTERKERGGEGGRGKKGIYIYKIYRVDPFLSTGVVSMRQLALLYMLVYSLHVLIRARTHIYTSVFSHEDTYTYARAHPRENVHAHMMHMSTKYMHAYARGTCTRAPTQCSCMCRYAHARTRLHMRPHSCKHTPTYFGCALTDWGHTPQP